MESSFQPPHTGKMVDSYLKQHEITYTQLAKELGLSRVGFTQHLQQPDLRTFRLWKISQVLKHNFFTDIADTLPVFSSSTPTANEQRLQEQINELQRVAERQQIELNVYKTLTKIN
jgi:hypothetical protein